MTFVVERSELPGIWTAQCLEVDACGYGKTPGEAVDSAITSVEMLLEDEPAPKPAPAELWR